MYFKTDESIFFENLMNTYELCDSSDFFDRMYKSLEEYSLNQHRIKFFENWNNDKFISYLSFHVDLPPFYNLESYHERDRRISNIWFLNVLLRNKSIIFTTTESEYGIMCDISQDTLENILHLIEKLERSSYDYKYSFILDLLKILENSGFSKEILLKYREIRSVLNMSYNKFLYDYFEMGLPQTKNKSCDDNSLSYTNRLNHSNFLLLWKKWGWFNDNENKQIPTLLLNTVNEFVQNGEKAILHEKLHPFLGKFTVDNDNIPTWWENFKNNLYNHCNENGLLYKGDPIHTSDPYEYSDSFQKMWDIVEYLEKNPALIYTGRIGEKENSPKFSKLLQHHLKVKDINSLDWFKVYNTNRTKKEKVNIIGTKHPVKVMGMSSFTGDCWRSCQTLKDNHKELAKGLWSDVINDTNMVLYITDQSKVSFSGLKEVKSEKIVSRVVIRLIQNDNNEYGIFLDRIYPDYRTGQAIVELVKQICRDNGLFFEEKGDCSDNLKTPLFKCLRYKCDVRYDFVTPYLDSAYLDQQFIDGEYWCYYRISNF